MKWISARSIFLCLLIIVRQVTFAQSFVTPDTVCVGAPVKIANTTNSASSYYRNFCVADINKAPTGTNLGNINASFTGLLI